MRYSVLIIFIILFFDLYGQSYKSLFVNRLDSAYYCNNSDSIFNYLENINYNIKYIKKDKNIARILDSIIFNNNNIISKKNIKKLLDKNIKIIQKENDKNIDIEGGYLLFTINHFKYKGNYVNRVSITSKKSLFVTSNKKNKMYVECKQSFNDDINYFINYVYFYKFISPILKHHFIIDSGGLNIELEENH